MGRCTTFIGGTRRGVPRPPGASSHPPALGKAAAGGPTPGLGAPRRRSAGRLMEAHVDAIRGHLVANSRAREGALALARETVRSSANAIRALHRHDFASAEQLAG